MIQPTWRCKFQHSRTPENTAGVDAARPGGCCRICCRSNARKSYATHSDTSRKWRAANPKKGPAYTQQRRARKAGVLNTLTDAEWLEIVTQAKGHCMYCSAVCERPEPDHIIPISHGGTHMATNIAAVCKLCNRRKRDRTIEDFWKELRTDGCVV